MSHLTQSTFAAGLIDRSCPTPETLRSWTGVPPVKRYGVYRNNVLSGLAAALAIRFPVTEKIVGTAFFMAMAREYVLQHPPRSPVLLQYGRDFDSFVAEFPPAQTLAYLADVVRLENARARAYHAADIAPLDPSELAHLDDGEIGELRLFFHPSFSVVRSTHPVLTIWGMNEGILEMGPIDNLPGEDVLVVRPALQILMHKLPPGGATFIAALSGGERLAAAAEGAMESSADFDLTANLTGLLGSGAVTAASCDG